MKSERTEHYYIRRRGIVANILGWSTGKLNTLYICEYLLRENGRVTHAKIAAELYSVNSKKMKEYVSSLLEDKIIKEQKVGKLTYYIRGEKMYPYLDEIDKILYA